MVTARGTGSGTRLQLTVIHRRPLLEEIKQREIEELSAETQGQSVELIKDFTVIIRYNDAELHEYRLAIFAYPRVCPHVTLPGLCFPLFCSQFNAI